MWRVFRIAVMWLLAVAIPVQGVAAASMLGCGPAHRTEAVAASSHQQDGQHHTGHAADLGDSEQQAADDTATPQPTASAHQQLAKDKCSACAACCVSAALPSAVAAFEPAKVSANFFAASAVAGVIFLTGGLDRPPRTSLV